MAKSSEAFRTIGEVSEDLAVPKHVLRFWEGKFPQLKPMKRGGGRRFYRPEDVTLLRGIKHLLHAAGYTIKGVQRILREDGVEAVKTLAAGGSGAGAHGVQTKGPPASVGVGAGGGADNENRDAARQTLPLKRGRRGGASGPRSPLPPAVRAALSEVARELDLCLALAKGRGSVKAPLPLPLPTTAKRKRG